MERTHLERASLIAVGTEITSGQILNRNAQWIARKLESVGLETVLHLVVPDDWALIRRGLEMAVAESNYVFVTGGLGPTSDDFTRKVVAEFLGEELSFDESVWQSVCDKLSSRGLTPKDMQKQQCWFPKSSVVLHNSAGTAAGFFWKGRENLKMWVLPGPPREIEAIWKDHVESQLREFRPRAAAIVKLIWNCLGAPESYVAERVEPIMERYPNWQVGYRVHQPYCEVKVWPKSQDSSEQSSDDSIEQSDDSIESSDDSIESRTALELEISNALSKWAYLRDGADSALLFCNVLSDRIFDRAKDSKQGVKDSPQGDKGAQQGEALLFLDGVSHGYLQERVIGAAREFGLNLEFRNSFHFGTSVEDQTGLAHDDESLAVNGPNPKKAMKDKQIVFRIAHKSSDQESENQEAQVEVELRWQGISYRQTISRDQIKRNEEFWRKWWTEQAILSWTNWLKKLPESSKLGSIT